MNMKILLQLFLSVKSDFMRFSSIPIVPRVILDFCINLNRVFYEAFWINL
jgi:hypothetical protein